MVIWIFSIIFVLNIKITVMKTPILFLSFLLINLYAQANLDSLLINEINILRTNPKSYIPLIEQYIVFQESRLESIKSGNLKVESISGTMNNSNNMECHKKLTDEDVINRNITSAKEAIIVLKNLKPLNPLEYSKEMDIITDSQGKYLESNNKFGHYGPKGNTVGDRFNNSKYRNVTENVGSLNTFSYNTKDFKPMILGMIIDSGVETRGHRNNLLNENSKYISVYVSKFIIIQNFAN